ncbi:hypothetical protein ANTQUA_LOCUS2445 [Anthophora quadrimaculata]
MKLRRENHCQKEEYRRSPEKLNSNVVKNICNNVSTLTEEKNIADKYKNILGSKKPVVLLKDCLMPGNLLNVPLKYSNLLIYNIPNKELRSLSNGKHAVIENSKDISANIHSPWIDTSSKYSEVTKNKNESTNGGICFEGQSSLTIVDESTCNEEYRKIMKNKALSDGKRLKVCLERIEQYDQNLNVMKTVHKDNDSQVWCDLNLLSNKKEDENSILNEEAVQCIKSKGNATNSKEASSQKENRIFESNYLLEKANEKSENVELQGESKDANRITDSGERIKIISLDTSIKKDCSLLEQNKDDTLICNNMLDIENNNENIEFSCVPALLRKTTPSNTNRISDGIHVEVKNSFSQKRKDINQNIDDETTKRMKLNICNTERSIVFETNGDKTMQSKSDESNLNTIQKLKIKSISDSKQTQDSEDQLCISDTNCSKEGEIIIEDDDTDCISLFADSALMQEYETPPLHNSACVENFCYRVNDVSKINHKSSTPKCNKISAKNIDNTEINILKEVQTYSVLKQPDSVAVDNTKTSQTIKDRLGSNSFRMFASIFKGYCFLTIKTGKCNRTNCTFNHNFMSAMIQFYLSNEQYYFYILDKLAFHKFTSFIYIFCYPSLLYFYSNCDINCTLKTIKKLYALQIINDKDLTDTIEIFHKNRITIKFVVDQLVTIVNHSDFKFVNWISRTLKNYVVQGEYWDTFKALLLKTKNLETEVVEIILQECTITQKNIHEVNVNIMRKLSNETRSQVNQELLSSFKSLIKRTGKRLSDEERLPASIATSIEPPVDSSTVSKSEPQKSLENTKDEHTEIIDTVNTVQEGKEKCDSNNEDVKDKTSDFTLHRIDELPEPNSEHGRTKFWKFYVDVHSLQKGLEHHDYDYVMNILNSAKEDQESFFSRACYQILCNEIKYSQYYLSKLISHTVHYGATSIFYRILLSVAIRILARLVEKDLWVLAYMLLQDILNVLNVKGTCLDDYDAAIIMLFTEVYIGNGKPLKAFSLLKQTNIIYTDPNKWKVKHNEEDSSIRSKIMTLLLDSLCKMFPEHAFFLFQFLILDQSGNFYPVDLVHFANKMISLCLLKEDHTMIIQIIELVEEYNFVLNTVTYRALISKLVHVDIALAKRLYQTAISLGIYFKIQFHPITYLIINTDCTNEEIYLALLNLIEELSSHIGHAINRINQKTFKIYLICENISFKEHFIYNRNNQQYNKEISRSTLRIRNILQESFVPPILLSKTSKRIMKIQNRSVIKYLKHKYCK